MVLYMCKVKINKTYIKKLISKFFHRYFPLSFLISNQPDFGRAFALFFCFSRATKVKLTQNCLPENKSLVNLFKGCGCGQRPQKPFCYCKFLIAKRLAIWRLNITAQAFKICDSNKEKATLLKLLICHFSRAD